MTETHIPEDDIQTLCGKDVRGVEMPAWDEETGDFSPATCPICRERIQLSPAAAAIMMLGIRETALDMGPDALDSEGLQGLFVNLRRFISEGRQGEP